MTTMFTTSWDDGHPLDLRMAELLVKYELPGTFYVPAIAPRPVMDGAAVREISAAGFEIGAHTMTHGNLLEMTDRLACAEMVDSKHYVEDLSGRKCTTFAPPGGRFRRSHLGLAATAGFSGLRTVELMNLGRPARRAGLAVMPTTLQVFPHSACAYVRNAAKRWRPGNLMTFLAYARTADLRLAAEALVAAALEQGGVFHLWGHTWEIEEFGLWPVVEQVFTIMRAERGRYRGVTNQELCKEVLRDEPIAKAVADPQLS